MAKRQTAAPTGQARAPGRKLPEDPDDIHILMDKMDLKITECRQVTKDATAAAKELRAAIKEAEATIQSVFKDELTKTFLLHAEAAATRYDETANKYTDQLLKVLDERTGVALDQFERIAEVMLKGIVKALKSPDIAIERPV